MKLWKICWFVLMVIAAITGIFAEGSTDVDSDRYFSIPNLEGFTRVLNATPANLTISVDEGYSVRAKGDQRVLDRFTFDIRDGVLRIRNPWRPWWMLSVFRDADVRIEVSMPRLESIRSTGSGSVRVDGRVSSDHLSLQATGSGGISAKGDADVVEIEITGSGDIDFQGNSKEANLDLAGAGSLNLVVETQSISTRISGSGGIDIVGSANELQLKVTGTGGFVGRAFTTDLADVKITGSGHAVLAVERELTAILSGSGDVQLVGDTPRIDAKTTGSGRVTGRD